MTIKIDKSRKMTVEAFIPSIKQGFTNDVFVPDPPTTRDQIQQQLELLFDRVARAYRTIFAAERDDLRDQADAIQLKLEVIAEQVAEEQAREIADPDALLSPTDRLRKIEPLLSRIEKQLQTERHFSPLVTKFKSQLHWITAVVHEHGSPLDKEALGRLTDQAERYIQEDDQRGVRFVAEQVYDLASGILHGQHWYWRAWLDDLKTHCRTFVNQAQAGKWIASADRAVASDNLPDLRSAVIELQKLLPPDQLEAAKEQAMQSGLKH